MARFYADENFEREVVERLRLLGHDVLTSVAAGNANASVADEHVLSFAVRDERIVLTHDRIDFVRLHKRRNADHWGIVICSIDRDADRLARRVHDGVSLVPSMTNQRLRINLGD